MYKNKKILGIIPARKGSKGIKNKNLSKIGNNSLIGYTSKFLSNIKFIDYSLISSDSNNYIDEAIKNGLKNFLIRSQKLSKDNSLITDVVFDILNKLKKNNNLSFDYILLFEPTSPLRIVNDVKKALDLIIIKNAYSVFSVSKIDSKYHPNKILKMNGKKISYYTKLGKTIINKQDIFQDYYYRNGLVYAIDAKKFMKKKLIISSNSYPILTKRYVSDIDTRIDLIWTNFLFNNKIND